MSPVIQALLLTLLVSLLLLIGYLSGGAASPEGIPNTPEQNVLAGMMIWCGFLFPAMTSVSASRGWMMRLTRLSYESLRPTTRRRFIQEIGLAFAIDMWAPWILFMLAVGLAMALLKPEMAMIFGVWCFFFCIPLIAYALTAFLSIYRSMALTMVAIMIAYVVLLGFAIRTSASDSSSVPYFLMLALASVFLIAFSYRNWCNADLD